MDVDDEEPPTNPQDLHGQSDQSVSEKEEDVDYEDEDVSDDQDNNDIGGDDVQQVEKDDNDDDCVGDAYEDDDLQRHPKKRKLKTLLSDYELAHRISAQSSVPKALFGRNPFTDWSERETLILLDAWGEKFLSQNRKNLRSEEWQEVAEKVSQKSKVERTDNQCRNRLDTLKKRYKKEKMKSGEIGESSSYWKCFKKMDTLFTSNSPRADGACGVELAECGSSYRKDYLNCSKGLDMVKNSPENSESSDGGEDAEYSPPKKTKNRPAKGSGASFNLLADSFLKFVEIYEKIENNKRLQMIELEKMRMDFHRDLELEKMRIQSEMMAKIQQCHEEDNDASA